MVVKVGCCGFPMKRAEYYRRFPLVEIQQTFYNLPRLSTVERWREEALACRPTFEFSLKAWQLITHEPSSPTYRRLRTPIPQADAELYGSFRWTGPVQTAWARTAEVARILGATVIVFQCPARFTPTDPHAENLRHFFRSIEREGFVMAWEPRGEWPPALVAALCKDLDLVHVVDPLKAVPQSGGIRYFRLHGVTGYRYLHTDQDLERIAAQCTADPSSYFLFNNLFMGEDALRLQRLLGQAEEVTEAPARARRDGARERGTLPEPGGRAA